MQKEVFPKMSDKQEEGNLTATGSVSRVKMGQVFQVMLWRYCWCTCSPSPYTLLLGSRNDSCRYWWANWRGPMLVSNLGHRIKESYPITLPSATKLAATFHIHLQIRDYPSPSQDLGI